MELLETALTQACRCVAVVGMAKNTGKTVTLNRLIREGNRAGLHLGVTSSGMDGEREDLVWQNPKPAIWVPAGTLLATAAGCLGAATARVEVLMETGYFTPLGQVSLVTVLSEGFVQLAGPSLGTHLAEISQRLTDLGADLVLIDGAIDRFSSAAPLVADGLILATGAIIAPSMEQVLEQTRLRLEQLSVPGVNQQVLAALSSAQGLAAISTDGVQGLGLPSALGYKQEIVEYLQARPSVHGLFIPGALTESVVDSVKDHLRKLGKFTLIVEDGTKIFLAARAWNNFLSLGGVVKARTTLTVLALTVNPVSPTGKSFEPCEFLQLARSYCSNLPVFDPCQLPEP